MNYDEFTEQDWNREFQHIEEPEKDIMYYKNLAAGYKALAKYNQNVINKLLAKIQALMYDPVVKELMQANDKALQGYQPVASNKPYNNPPKKS